MPSLLGLVVVQIDDGAHSLSLDLGGVVTRLLDLVQVVFVHITGHVLAIEYRAVEIVDLDLLAAADRLDQVIEVLIDQPVSADQVGNILRGAVVRDEFMCTRHVDAVDVRVPHSWRRRAEIDVFGASFTGHLDDLLAGGAAHDGVIHQHHVLATELEFDGVELLAHGLLARSLPRHDESTTDVTVLDEAFAELDAQVVGQFQGSGTAGVRNRDDHVDVVVRALAKDLVGQLLAHAQTRLVDRDAVDDRVRTRQIDVFENARCIFGIGGALAGVQLAVFGDVHRFARREVANQGEAKHVQGHAFRGDHVLDDFVGVTLAEYDRTDGVRVTETDDAITGDHCHHGVTTAAAVVHVSHGSEDVFFGGLQLATLGQFMSENVEQHFRIGIGVDVAQVRFVDLLGQLLDVGQVAVVRQGNAIRRVDVKRLGFGRSRTARGWITHMANTHMTDQALHVTLMKHITDQPVVLAQE